MADTGGLQWFQLKPPLRIAHIPNLFTICVGDNITKSYTHCVILELFLLAKLHTFAFEKSAIRRSTAGSFFSPFFGLRLKAAIPCS